MSKKFRKITNQCWSSQTLYRNCSADPENLRWLCNGQPNKHKKHTFVGMSRQQYEIPQPQFFNYFCEILVGTTWRPSVSGLFHRMDPPFCLLTIRSAVLWSWWCLNISLALGQPDVYTTCFPDGMTVPMRFISDFIRHKIQMNLTITACTQVINVLMAVEHFCPVA